MQDLIGKTFGKLTIIEESTRKSKNKYLKYWKCLCSCGNYCERTMYSLNHSISAGKIPSCNTCKRSKDLSGMTFGRLTVIRQSNELKTFPNGKHGVMWDCKCECGNETTVLGWYLLNGDTKSCGCLHKEKSAERGFEQLKKYNTWDLSGDFGIGYTCNGEPFYFDKDCYELIKNHYWYYDSNGYVTTKIKRSSQIKLHRLVMNAKRGEYVDHIIHPPRKEHKIDNRRSNLRIVTNSQNCMNQSLRVNNSSGYKGISYNKSKNKWIAYIGVNNKYISLGDYERIEDAINARKAAEKRYFGEYSLKDYKEKL